jgi:regulatory protein YycH of two-component signal transduction system YycFG
MIERIKSVLLIFLVVLSLYLTYQLWYGKHPAELIVEDIYEQIEVERPRQLEQIISPSQIAVFEEEMFYLLRENESAYEVLWDELSVLLQNSDPDLDQEGSSLPPEKEPCYTYYFDPLLPVGEETPWLNSALPMLINKIEIHCFEESLWLSITEDSEEEIYLIIKEGPYEQFMETVSSINLSSKLAQVFITESLVTDLTGRQIRVVRPIYLSQEPVYLDDLAVRTEQLDRELLLKTFFVDYSLARIIEERDGGVIYTDGDKGLRLTYTGLLFSNPQIENGQSTFSYNTALLAGGNYLSYHGGWPVGLRLEEVKMIRRARTSYYSTEWLMYHEGLPLFTNQATRAIFNDLGLVSYTRSVFNVVSTTDSSEKFFPAAPWTEALISALNYFEERFPGFNAELSLEAMSLGYAIAGSATSMRGVPVWFVQLNGEKFYLSAETLILLSEEDML